MPHIDLLELPYFDGISAADLVSLVDTLEPRQFKAGAVLLMLALVLTVVLLRQQRRAEALAQA